MVTDPFAPITAAQLETSFDRVSKFKEHLIVDLSKASSDRTSRHHRYYARRAQRLGVTVERVEQPVTMLGEWTRLYEVLAQRHQLTGIKRFSRKSFKTQLAVPGAVLFRALKDGATIAAHLWYLQGDFAYSHLQATNPAGYEMRAPYALYGAALDWLSDRCSLADLGAAAGSAASPQDGLSHFKRGWATETRTAHFCGRIFDQAAYAELTELATAGPTSYIPSYRAGELA
jgi:hypothetical protein